jgi:hypothetical protein
VTSIELSPITADELAAWVARRFAAVGVEPAWTVPHPVAADLAARAGPSWRVAGDLLHAWVAEQVMPHHDVAGHHDTGHGG